MKPLISCLMVTQPGREPLARKAVDCFRRQTYERCELVIVPDATKMESVDPGGERNTFEQFLHETADDARVVWTPPGKSLGELRNAALEAAKGEFICQWDDDDQYHPDRVTRQWEALTETQADACFLASQLHYFAGSRELYVRDTGRRGIEGTVMHRRDLPVRYPAIGKEEDTVFMRDLARRFSTTILHGTPWLYLRVFHGSNTWDEAHHRYMMHSSWDVHLLRTWQDEIVRHTQSYDIEGPVTVRGHDGRAFGISSNDSILTSATP